MEKINVVTLCSGYDSQMLALERLKDNVPYFEAELVAWAEIDRDAIKAHNALFPQYADRNVGDITTCDWSIVNRGQIDLLTYSTPCTDISNAGKQAGLAEGSGTRSSIIWDVKRAIVELKPKYLLLENVKALTQKKFMPFFKAWQDTLTELGYTNFWQVLNAKDYGVAQNRERVFMVSIYDPDHTAHYNFPTPTPLTKCVEDYMEPAEDVGEEYFIDQKRVTEKVLSDILDQPNVRAEMEKLYHEEWNKANSD